MHVTDRIKRAKRAPGVCGTWGTCPPGKFLISDLRRSLLVLFWGKTAKIGRITAKSSHCVC